MLKHPALMTSTQRSQETDPESLGQGSHLGSEDLDVKQQFCYPQVIYKCLRAPVFPLKPKLTCDLADGEVVTSATLGVPGRAFDTVCSSCLKVVKSHHGVSGVKFEAGAGALSDDAESVKDCVPHRGPGNIDGVVGG